MLFLSFCGCMGFFIGMFCERFVIFGAPNFSDCDSGSFFVSLGRSSLLNGWMI